MSEVVRDLNSGIIFLKDESDGDEAIDLLKNLEPVEQGSPSLLHVNDCDLAEEILGEAGIEIEQIVFDSPDDEDEDEDEEDD